MSQSRRASNWALVLLVLAMGVGPAGAQQQIETGRSLRHTTVHRVLFDIDASGQIHLRPSGRATDSKNLEMTAKFDYLERHVRTDAVIQAARYYNSARARIKVGNGSTVNSLDDDTRYFVIESSTDARTARLRLRRPEGTVSVEQAELLEAPLDSSVMGNLLPVGRSIRVDETWQAESADLAAMFWLDSITHNGIECRLYRVRSGDATISVAGKVLGAVDGVATEIDVNGSLTYKIDGKYISAGRFTIHENRSIGQAQPGFEITAKIEFRSAPDPSAPALSDEVVESWSLVRDPSTNLATFQSRLGGFEFVHDRRWHIISDQHNATVLRLVEQGDLIAQCNLTRLEDLTAGTRLELDKFRSDVAKAITPYAGQIADAKEDSHDDGKHILRIMAAGTIDEVSLLWIYYHVTDQEGRRAASVVSMESDRVERFAELDRTIIESISFTDRPDDE